MPRARKKGDEGGALYDYDDQYGDDDSNDDSRCVELQETSFPSVEVDHMASVLVIEAS